MLDTSHMNELGQLTGEGANGVIAGMIKDRVPPARRVKMLKTFLQVRGHTFTQEARDAYQAHIDAGGRE